MGWKVTYMCNTGDLREENDLHVQYGGPTWWKVTYMYNTGDLRGEKWLTYVIRELIREAHVVKSGLHVQYGDFRG